MFAGKSTELVRRYERALRARRRAVVLRHAADVRPYARHGDRASDSVLGRPVTTAAEVASSAEGAQVVLIDEIQFMAASEAPELIQVLRATPAAVTVFGLDLDASGAPFGAMPALMAEADSVVKLRAVCDCGAEATRTQRLRPGATVGGAEAYRAVCRGCWRPCA